MIDTVIERDAACFMDVTWLGIKIALSYTYHIKCINVGGIKKNRLFIHSSIIYTSKERVKRYKVYSDFHLCLCVYDSVYMLLYGCVYVTVCTYMLIWLCVCTNRCSLCVVIITTLIRGGAENLFHAFLYGTTVFSPTPLCIPGNSEYNNYYCSTGLNLFSPIKPLIAYFIYLAKGLI